MRATDCEKDKIFRKIFNIIITAKKGNKVDKLEKSEMKL